MTTFHLKFCEGADGVTTSHLKFCEGAGCGYMFRKPALACFTRSGTRLVKYLAKDRRVQTVFYAYNRNRHSIERF